MATANGMQTSILGVLKESASPLTRVEIEQRLVRAHKSPSKTAVRDGLKRLKEFGQVGTQTREPIGCPEYYAIDPEMTEQRDDDAPVTDEDLEEWEPEQPQEMPSDTADLIVEQYGVMPAFANLVEAIRVDVEKTMKGPGLMDEKEDVQEALMAAARMLLAIEDKRASILYRLHSVVDQMEKSA